MLRRSLSQPCGASRSERLVRLPAIALQRTLTDRINTGSFSAATSKSAQPEGFHLLGAPIAKRSAEHSKRRVAERSSSLTIQDQRTVPKRDGSLGEQQQRRYRFPQLAIHPASEEQLGVALESQTPKTPKIHQCNYKAKSTEFGFAGASQGQNLQAFPPVRLRRRSKTWAPEFPLDEELTDMDREDKEASLVPAVPGLDRACTCPAPCSPAAKPTAMVPVCPSLERACTCPAHCSAATRPASLMDVSTTGTISPLMGSTPSMISPGACSIGSSVWSVGETSRRAGGGAVSFCRWQRGEKIGQGSYGSVYKALDKDTGLIFVVKRANLDDKREEDSSYRDRLEDELKICKDLRHPHIVSYFGHQYVDHNLYIYLEYVSGGSMASILREFGPVEGPLLHTATCGLLEGLNYLHTRSPPVVHRDIKGANILVSLEFCVKLADFGCSKRSDCTKSLTTIGSIPWMAPEVIQQQDGHGRKADIWSLGCTLIEMVTAEKPWGKHMFDNFMFAMSHIGLSDAVPPIPQALPQSAKEFISRCVQRSPDERPTSGELLHDKFIANGGLSKT